MSDKKAALLRAMLEAEEEEQHNPYADLPLDTLVATFNQHHEFKVGDKVQWKPGMKMMNWPQYDQECVVMQVLPSPIIHGGGLDDDGRSLQQFDIVLGATQRRSFTLFHFDSRRFEPVKVAQKRNH